MTQPSTERLQSATADLQRLEAAVRSVYIGQDALVSHVLTALVAGGNVLLEGAPGLGKTLLVRVLSQALALEARRIQFTPDLMPADITGGTTLVREDGGGTRLTFRPGPVFANIVLADEINRGTPRTQSALLEAMQERSVTVGGEHHVLDAPFFVIATQNPIEHEGTYPLPEAQLDRFLMKLLVPFPGHAELVRIGLETTRGAPLAVDAVLDRAGLLRLQALCRDIVVSDALAAQAARLVLATHPDRSDSPAEVRRFVRYGASPRAMQALLQAGRARALLAGRPWASADDLRAVAAPVLRHRVHLGLEAELEGVGAEALVAGVVAAVLPA